MLLGVTEVVIATTILEEDEDVDPLEVDVILMVADIVFLIKAPDNVSIVGGTTTFQRSAGRSLVALNRHS